MKRALKKRVKVVLENTPSEDAPVENMNVPNLKGNRRVRTQAAMIGLAISMGATSLLVTRQSDQALAAEPVGNQNTASAIPASDTEVKFAATSKLESQAITNVSLPENSVIVEPTAISQVPGLGAKWQASASGVAAKSIAPTTLNKAVASSQNLASALKGERIASAIAKVQASNAPEVTVNSVPSISAKAQTGANDFNSQLKAQQEFAISRLQQKSDRLRASLAELRSEETNKLSESIKNNAINQQSQAVSGNGETNLLPGLTQNAGINANSSASVTSKVYEVKSGDTLAAIASNYGTSVSELVKANNLNNPNQLKISQKLNIPVASATVTKTKVENAVSEVKPSAIAPKVVNSPDLSLTANSAVNNEVASQQTTSANNTTSDEIASKQAITAITSPTVVSSTYFGMGGDTPVPKVITEMQQAKNGARNKELKQDPGLRSLQEEIERLRQKYRAQQSGGRGIQQLNPKTVAIPVPTYKQNTVAVPVSPTVNQQRNVAIPVPTYRPNNVAVPIQVPRPMAPTYSAQPINPEWAPSRNARNNPIPVPTGVNASEALGNMRGMAVSPQLPPLAAVDRYLPRAVEGNTPLPNVGAPGVASTYIWPAKGVLTSGYGWRWGRMHKGIDVANGVGTPIYASAPGIVQKAGWNNGGYGYLVEILHPDGSMTRYGHNSRIRVQTGQQVQQGQVIADMGSTGFSTGPHSHFEIHPSGKGAVNPIAFLPPRV